MKPTKRGRKSIKSKPSSIPNLTYDDVFGNPLNIPRELAQELADKGLGARWISYKQLVENAGYHKRGWVPYKKENRDTMSSEEFQIGVGPDGFIRRGTMVLGVKPIEEVEKHKRFLSHRAKRYKAGFQQKKAAELREAGQGVDESFVVHEGYDDDAGTD